MMKLEYFARGSMDTPLILIYGKEPAGVLLFQNELMKLLQSHINQVAVHELSGFSSVDSCQLIAIMSEKDTGVWKLAAANQFECCLQAETWMQVVELLEPFTNESERDNGIHFQYLDSTGPISLLISTARSW